MLYHLGALKRLNEFGLLSVVDRFSTVSAGSIVGAILGMLWSRLAFGADGVATGFDSVEEVIFELAGWTVDWQSALVGLLPGTTGAAQLSRRLQSVFAHRGLSDLPAEPPRFTFNTTNMQTGSLFRWNARYGADYRLGRIEDPQMRLADVVAASAAFPPFLSPLRVLVPGRIVDFATGLEVADPPARLWLTDGGVYDNLGVETAKSFHSVLASDGGAPFAFGARLHTNPFSQALRTTFLLNDHVGRQRRRQFVGELAGGQRLGALWTISTPIDRYPARGVLPCPSANTARLAAIKTRLRSIPVGVRNHLVNWGYASADAAIRSYVEPTLPPPEGFPRPGGVGTTP